MFSFLALFITGAALLQGPAAKPAQAAQPAPAPLIIWSATRRLAVADFAGRPPMGDPLAANTSSNIKADAKCRDYVFSSTAQATFDPNTSWLRNPKTASEALLRHEQLHFDITELYARIMRQKLAVFAVKADCAKLQPAFNNTTKGVYDLWDKEQNRYDQATNHGLNAASQALWEKQVREKLALLQAFAVAE